MLVLDTSALVKRYVDEAGSDTVIEAMASDPLWCGSALCGAEAHVTLCDLGLSPKTLDRSHRALRADWERFHVVPLDGPCMARAGEIGCEHRVRTLDAVHLAAADRLPRPFRFLTFDRDRARGARSCGFEVVGAGGS